MNLSTRTISSTDTGLLGTAPKALPLFVRISELITREIAAGHYRAGERLPTEAELAAQLKVAVGTLRKGLALLETRGLLERRQGSGTYVRSHSGQPPQARSIYEFFRLELQEGGGLPTARVLGLQRVVHSARIPVFGQGTRGHCYRVRRLRLLNKLPVALEEIWFDARHRRALQAQDLGEALYQFYGQQLGFWVTHVEDRVSAGPAPDWSPEGIGLAAGQPCGKIDRWSYAGTGVLEEFSTTWFHPERARYVARWS
jgi:GntR family transcriptional regulator